MALSSFGESGTAPGGGCTGGGAGLSHCTPGGCRGNCGAFCACWAGGPRGAGAGAGTKGGGGCGLGADMLGTTIPAGCCIWPLVTFASGDDVGLGTCFTTKDVNNSKSRGGRVRHTLLFDHVPDLTEDIKWWPLARGSWRPRYPVVALGWEIHGCHEFSWSPHVGCGLLGLIIRLLVRTAVRLVLRTTLICHIIVLGITNDRMRRWWERHRSSVHRKGDRGRWRGRPLPRDPVGCLGGHILTWTRKMSTVSLSLGCRSETHV